MNHRLSGVISPNLTPFNEDLSVAEDLYIRHAHWLLEQGCSAITPFGTTGEALSIGMGERKQLLESLIKSGISPERLMVGTGQTSLPDTIELSRHAMEQGCVGVMVLPPFYFKGVSDEGIFNYFDALVHAVPNIRIFLYHIPPVAVVGFSVDLVKRLYEHFPEQIVGLKDSSGDWDNTASIMDNVSELTVFPGAETFLLPGLRHGAAGCITATANINTPAIVDLYEHYQDSDADNRHNRIYDFRMTVQPYSPIPAMKWLLADATGDTRWRIVRPPLLPLSDKQGQELKSKLANQFDFSLSWG